MEPLRRKALPDNGADGDEGAPLRVADPAGAVASDMHCVCVTLQLSMQEKKKRRSSRDSRVCFTSFFYFVFNNDIHNANCRFFFFLLSFVSISNGKTQYRRTSASSVSSLFHVCVRFFDISIYTNDAAAHTVEKKKFEMP